jgi:phosphoribosyl 1,2-cyclic phosphodiesterase
MACDILFQRTQNANSKVARITVEFHGTRGSIPVCSPKYQKFGGNTSCISIFNHETNRIGILDAGTGIRQLGKRIKSELPDQKNLFITFTHFHWDHIQGLPFFEPAYDPEMEINIMVLGVRQEFTNLQEIFEAQMQQEYFPVSLDNMGCRFNFLKYNDSSAYFRKAGIRSIKQNHPGGSYGYRLESEETTLVVCTDVEHGEKVNPEIVDFCKGADLLVHDAQYTSEELPHHRGWGHSSFEQALEVAEQAGVGQLVMTHHDPDHDDDFLTQVEKRCQKRFKNCALAREGMTIDL